MMVPPHTRPLTGALAVPAAAFLMTEVHMSALFVVFNKNRTEGAAFTDRADAYQAAGIEPMSNPCSSLAAAWREIYADDEPRARFVVAAVETGDGHVEALEASVRQLSECLQSALTGGQVSAKKAGKALVRAAELLGEGEL